MSTFDDSRAPVHSVPQDAPSASWVVDWRDLLISLAVVFGWFLIAPLRFVLPENWADYAWSSFVVQVSVPGMLALAAVAVVLRHRGEVQEAMGLRPTTRRAIGIGLAMFGVTLAVDLILQALFRGGDTSATAASNLASTGPAGVAAVWVFSVVLTPLMEEVFFRGVLFAGIRRYWGFLAGALISSVVFAISHGLDPIAFPSTLFAGFIYAWLYERYGSVWPAVASHVLNNAMAALLLIFT